ncbi:MAG: PD-(D/E)XK nuclease family protein [Nanoarchaeota archaeon]|nr:PD-(D/E)XK nuclease family protein [Nanoarchaeota archaeon]
MSENGLKIEDNDAYAKCLTDTLRVWLDKPRNGIHVSDLLFPRATYFSKISPQPLTDKEVGYFVAGRAHHEVIEALAGNKRFRENTVTWNGIEGNIDFIENVPVEIKTTRAQTVASPEKLNKHYLDQLGYYCAMTDSNNGRLVIFYLGARETASDGKRVMTPKFKVFDIKYPDLESIRKDMISRKDLLMNAVKTKDFTSLPKCPEWKCGSCKYRDKCVS